MGRLGSRLPIYPPARDIDLRNRYTIINFPIFLRQRTGEYVAPSSQLGTPSTYADVPADTLYATYLLIPQRARLDGLWMNVVGAGAAGARIRMGIYADDGNLYPGRLLLDAGEVSAETTGGKTLSIDLVLNPGIYWFVFVTNDPTIDLRYFFYIPVLEASTWSGWSVVYAYAALPSTYPAGGGVSRSFEFRYRMAEWLR